MSERLKLSLLLLLALLQGVMYMIIVPPWQHYDEPTHFEYAWLIAKTQRLQPESSDQDNLMRREVLASMVRADFFEGDPPAWTTDRGEVWIGITELTHPPAYYAYLSTLLSPLRYLDVTTQMYVARAMTLLLYLGTIGFIYAITAELTPRGHTLRWLVPLTAILVGPFANQMTAVNNDAASAFALSLFLWVALRLVRQGFTLPRLLLLGLTALLAVFSKNTTALAVALMPHVLVLVWWLRGRWSWRWLWLGFGVLALLFVFLFFEWGDAAYWYRSEYQAAQVNPTQSLAPTNSAYPYAVRVTVDQRDNERRLLNPLFRDQVRQIAGKSVTVGGWIWADRTDVISAPGLLLSNQNSTDLYALTEPLTVTTSPTFVVNTYTVPETAAVAYYTFFGNTVITKQEVFDVYLQGAFVIDGEWPQNVPLPTEGQPVPTEVMSQNLIRNGTGTEGWPRLRTWVDQSSQQYLRRSPSYLFSALLDVQRNVPFIFGAVAPHLLNDFFVAYGWGHVRFTADWFNALFIGMTVVAFVGMLLWYRRSSQTGRDSSLIPAISVLAVAGGLVWIAALTWPLPYNWARSTLPSARYTFAAIAPTILFLTAGWWALWSPRWRPFGIALYLIILVSLNIAGIWRLITYYA